MLSINQTKLLTIVIPCFNEELVINETVVRLLSFCDGLSNLNTELVFVDDGSIDSTLDLIIRFAKDDERIKVLSLAKNFGHQVAVTAGIDYASGDAIVIIDADLQDPPEVIKLMIEKWMMGFDVVYGTRLQRLGESWFKLITAKVFYRILRALSDTSIPSDTGDFRLITRAVADVLRQMPEHDRFIRGMVSWVGFKQTAILYQRSSRYAGTSKYTIKRMASLAIDGIFSFSTRPLTVVTVVGLVTAILALLAIVYVLFVRLYTDIWVEGWAAIMIAILLTSGIQLIAIGIIGEYIGRIYKEVKNRPLYVVKNHFGFNDLIDFNIRTSANKRNF